MARHLSVRRKITMALLAGITVTSCLFDSDRVAAFRGGFGGFRDGGFGGFQNHRFGGFDGASRFGDGGFSDRSIDSGFGRGGWGNIHSSGTFNDRADTFQQNHPEYHSNVSQYQQNRFNEANTLQQNRFNETNNLQYNRVTSFDNYKGSWGGYYSGLGFGAGMAIGATVAALPMAAVALTVAGTPYWYSNGVYYESQGGQYAVVPPPQGAVVPAPPPSCSTVDLGAGKTYDCGGAFYSTAPNGYAVVPPPIGIAVPALPNGAVVHVIAGTTYFTFGGAWYQPMYSSGGVMYRIVAQPG